MHAKTREPVAAGDAGIRHPGPWRAALRLLAKVRAAQRRLDRDTLSLQLSEAPDASRGSDR